MGPAAQLVRIRVFSSLDPVWRLLSLVGFDGDRGPTFHPFGIRKKAPMLSAITQFDQLVCLVRSGWSCPLCPLVTIRLRVERAEMSIQAAILHGVGFFDNGKNSVILVDDRFGNFAAVSTVVGESILSCCLM